MFDVGEGDEQVRLMSETIINDVVFEMQTKLIYVYDFLSMWTFLVELAEIVDENSSTDYPNLMFVCGQVPSEAPEKQFEAEDPNSIQDGADDLFDDYGESWNWN